MIGPALYRAAVSNTSTKPLLNPSLAEQGVASKTSLGPMQGLG